MQQELQRKGLELGSMRYEIYPSLSAAGTGRISMAGEVVSPNPIFERTEGDWLQLYMDKAGIPRAKHRHLIDQVGRRESFKIVAEAGARFPFTRELFYQETVSGLNITVQQSTQGCCGYPHTTTLPAGAYIEGEFSGKSYLKKILDLYEEETKEAERADAETLTILMEALGDHPVVLEKTLNVMTFDLKKYEDAKTPVPLFLIDCPAPSFQTTKESLYYLTVEVQCGFKPIRTFSDKGITYAAGRDQPGKLVIEINRTEHKPISVAPIMFGGREIWLSQKIPWRDGYFMHSMGGITFLGSMDAFANKAKLGEVKKVEALGKLQGAPKNGYLEYDIKGRGCVFWDDKKYPGPFRVITSPRDGKFYIGGIGGELPVAPAFVEFGKDAFGKKCDYPQFY